MKKILLLLALLVPVFGCSSNSESSQTTDSSSEVENNDSELQEESSEDDSMGSQTAYILEGSQYEILQDLADNLYEEHSEVEEDLDEDKIERAGKILLDLSDYYQIHKDQLPEEETFLIEEDDAFLAVEREEALGHFGALWSPDYREIAFGLINEDGSVDDRDGLVYDFTQNEEFSLMHINYGNIIDEMLNGEGTSFAAWFKNDEFNQGRLVKGNFTNNRPDGEMELNYFTNSSPHTATIYVDNGKLESLGKTEDGKDVLAYFDEGGNWFSEDGDLSDYYVTWYDRLTDLTTNDDE